MEINAVIYCEKASHKGIIIGKRGAMLKEIGQQARADIERMLDAKVFLELWVKVKEGTAQQPVPDAQLRLRGSVNGRGQAAALGLREVDFGDFDRYLTALTEDGRRIEILCKNARRGKKQNPAARQLCYSEFILSDRGGRYTLRDAPTLCTHSSRWQAISRSTRCHAT